MRRTQWLLAFLILAASQAEIEAGLFHRKGKEEVPGGSPPNLVAPNGVVVPQVGFEANAGSLRFRFMANPGVVAHGRCR